MHIYEKIGLKRVINANGRMTSLGVSTLSDEVASVAISGGQSYVVIDELIEKAGEIISSYTGAEDSCVASSASAAICLVIAGLISKGNKKIMDSLPNSLGEPNEVIIQKGHMVQFGAPISTLIHVAGGKTIEVGMANKVVKEDIVGAINSKTVALMYVKSHHCIQKGMLDIKTMLDIAHLYDLPLVVDAAAEEDLKKYVSLGVDAVIYSGAKAIEATTSGFATGKKEIMVNARKQYNGIGRPMKIGKEGVMGLLKALELYDQRDINKIVEKNIEDVKWLNSQINQIPGLSATMIQDEAGRDIYRSKVEINNNVSNKTAVDLDAKMREGSPSIHCRNYQLAQGILFFDTRPLVPGDKEIIVKRLKELMEE